MRFDYGRHNRQSEADTAARAGAGGIRTVEPLEHAAGLLGRHPRPFVPDFDDRISAGLANAHMRRGLRRRMGTHVRQEVVEHLPQPVSIADHDRGLGLDRDQAPGLHRSRRLDRLDGDLAQLDRLAVERAPLVEPGEQQQIVDEETHALALALDPAHRPLQVVRPLARTTAEQLGVGPHAGERRPQLMRGIGDEAAQSPFGRLARVERRLDLPQHAVQGKPEPADLRPLLCPVDASGEIPRSDRPGGLPDRVQRPQADPHDPEAEPEDRRKHRRRDEKLDQEQPVERALHVLQRCPHDEHHVRAGVKRCAQAVCPSPVLAGTVR